MSDIDPMSFYHRIQLVDLQMGRVADRAEQARKAGDTETMEACLAESSVLLESARQIREEQLIAQMNGYREPKAPGRKPWWRRWLGR